DAGEIGRRLSSPKGPHPVGRRPIVRRGLLDRDSTVATGSPFPDSDEIYLEPSRCHAAAPLSLTSQTSAVPVPCRPRIQSAVCGFDVTTQGVLQQRKPTFGKGFALSSTAIEVHVAKALDA